MSRDDSAAPLVDIAAYEHRKSLPSTFAKRIAAQPGRKEVTNKYLKYFPVPMVESPTARIGDWRKQVTRFYIYYLNILQLYLTAAKIIRTNAVVSITL